MLQNTNINTTHNGISKRSSVDQDQIRYFPEAWVQGIQGQDQYHYLPAGMPNPKLTPEHEDLIHQPVPKPTLCLATSNFAAFGDFEGNAVLKRESPSTLDTNTGLTNRSSDDLTFLHAQSSPEGSSVTTLDDNSYTPLSSTFSTMTPLSWPSSTSLSSSSSSSAVPCTWNPHPHPQPQPQPQPHLPETSAAGNWTSVPCSFNNGNSNNQYGIPSANQWDSGAIPPTNEEMMMLFNGLPWMEHMQPETPSSPYLMNYYGAEMDPALRAQVPQLSTPMRTAFTYPAPAPAPAPTTIPTNENTYPRFSQRQPIYTTTAPTTTTTTTNTTRPMTENPTMTSNIHIHACRESQRPSTASSASAMPNSRNAFLIECKRRGLSYKDIKRIGGFKEAESTLRGRFRTLTKSKEQRVRKPQWQERDIRLLCEAVNICSLETHSHSHSHSSSHSHSHKKAYNPLCRLRGSSTASSTSTTAQHPPKVSWKKVAHYIWTHGGSYHFGNATCKKKWCEVYSVNGERRF